MALYSIVHDIAGEQHGIESEEFFRHYEIRRRVFYAYYLERIKRLSPKLTAQIDERYPNEPPPKQSYPPLFPDNEKEH